MEWTMETIKVEMSSVCDRLYNHRNGFVHHGEIFPHAENCARKFFGVISPEAVGQMPPAAIQKYNELVKTLANYQSDLIYKHYWNNINTSWGVMRATSNGNYDINIISGLWCHEEKINKLESAFSKLNNILETFTLKNRLLEHRIQNLENHVSDLTLKNKILEKNCINYSMYASIIQKYWKKYMLMKRIKEASRVYKLTKNFIKFINPHEILQNSSEKNIKTSISTVSSDPKMWSKSKASHR
jgi:hypothetical protein